MYQLYIPLHLFSKGLQFNCLDVFSKINSFKTLKLCFCQLKLFFLIYEFNFLSQGH